MNVNDLLRGLPRGTPDEAKAYARSTWAIKLGDVDKLIDELYRLGRLYHLDSSILVAQSAQETWDWGGPENTGSNYWEVYCASAGLGAFDDGTYVGGGFGDGTHAARAQFAHMAAYCGVDLPDDLEGEDPVYERVADAGYVGSVIKLGDLGSGRWATDKNYAQKIADKGNRIYADVAPGKPTAPDVAKPLIYDLANNYGSYQLTAGQAAAVLNNFFPNRSGGRPLFPILHIQAGRTPGSLAYWATVDASSTVMIQRDGSILKVIPEQHGPWTNGDVKYPTAAAMGLINKGGNANNWSLTIEAEGGPWDEPSAKQDDAIVWQLEDWSLRYPEIMASLTANILSHYMINTVDKMNCGIYRPRIVERIANWLSISAPVEPKPLPVSLYPKGMSKEMARELYELDGKFTASWTSKEIGFDIERTECQAWLIRGAGTMTDPKSYLTGRWPCLSDIIRRGKNKNVHAYVYSDGSVYEKLIHSVPTT